MKGRNQGDMSDSLKQSERNWELLIRIDEKQKAFNDTLVSLHKDLSDIKGEFSNRLKIMEEDKIGRAEVETLSRASIAVREDHEKRIRNLEKWGGFAIGGLYVIFILVEIFVKRP